MNKVSIRFFDDTEIHAIWDEENAKWWFSVLDVVGVLNKENDYSKIRNYWKNLKTKLKNESNQTLSGVNQLTLLAPDGESRLTDTLDSHGIIELAKNFPDTNTMKFLDWFQYNDNTIDEQSKKKAYTLFESNILDTFEVGTAKGLQQIHAYLFGGLYDFAGQIRQKNISKGGFPFAASQFLVQTLKQIEALPETSFDEIVEKYVEMNIAHPFMEGNGRSARIWLDLILKKHLSSCVDWSKIGKQEYMNAMIVSPTKSTVLKTLLKNALTTKINDLEMFRKGIDYSYYFEEHE